MMNLPNNYKRELVTRQSVTYGLRFFVKLINF